MKNFKYLLGVFVALFILTGCEINLGSSKDKEKNDDNKEDIIEIEDHKKDDNIINDINANSTLSCTTKAAGMDINMEYTWKEGKINTVKVTTSIDLSQSGMDDSMLDVIASTMAPSYMEQIKQAYGLPANQEGFEVDYTVNKENKTIDATIFVDADKIDPEMLSDNSLFSKNDYDKTYEDIKSELTSSGAVCK